MQAPAVLINLFEVPVGREKQLIDWWKRCSELLKQEPGFLDATLHQSLLPEARYRFINVARWETEACLAQARVRYQEALQFGDLGKSSPAMYEVILQY